MLEKQNFDNLKSETLHFPNLNSLMKISLGLILFTMISTMLVYAQTSSDITSVQINENAYLQKTSSYVDNSLFSSSPGTTITIVNNDIVSHTFVSGASNSNNAGLVANYDNYLICEFGVKIPPTTNKYSDDNVCDFNKDNRIITDVVPPGNSVSFSLIDLGTYRIIDPDYPWMEFVIYSFPNPDSSKNINSGFLSSDRISTPISESQSEPAAVSVETLSVTVDGMPFDVNYSTTGLTVYEIESDTDSMSLIFYVDVFELTGKLDVTFDRVFFDSIYDGVDDSFFILSDGDETIFKETQTTSESRTLTIDVPSGTEELEIIGSVFNSFNVIETPVVETPVVETPVVETPVVETPVVETPTQSSDSNQCGPGTVLEGDSCVLDQRCGPGTVLEGDSCVLNPNSISPTKSLGTSKELIISFTGALAIAGTVGIIFALISKANRNKP